ncbi:hypothetical protein [Streptomyces cinereoruber]|uniref:hypothetical protein n=1 Tax=Streptomyces cinereoruber TaxID=67260 RepID=UPI003640C106
MALDLSAAIARMDHDDLADLTDVLFSMRRQTSGGTEQRAWADDLIDQVIAAQEACERG